jgi:hypothetical protein
MHAVAAVDITSFNESGVKRKARAPVDEEVDFGMYVVIVAAKSRIRLRWRRPLFCIGSVSQEIMIKHYGHLHPW